MEDPRADEAGSAHQRLRGLLAANQSIVGNLAPEVVLKRIVEAACELLEARYGALGVLSPDGHGLEQFIHVGIDDAKIAEIGHLPEGKGVLGALIDHPAPIRLHELSDDPRSVGFPSGHPPMHTFLGVPITVRGEVFGNLYLTERRSGDFTAEDVELASALAATAAIAIENARLFEETRRRQLWSQAAADVALSIVTEPGAEALRVIASRVRELADADVVTLVLPDSGEAAAAAVPAGPTMELPLAGRDVARGTLVVGRQESRARFSEADLEMATTFANQAALALELAESRQDQERMHIFEERDRIARDLHDHVIQQLFAAGLTLQGVSMGMTDRVQSERIERVVESLDSSIRQIRTAIFDLRDHVGPTGAGVRAAIVEAVGSVAEVLGFEPEVRFKGPVDTVVDAALTDDLVAVVREALTNVARHAGAGRAEVALSASSHEVELRVADDGRGLGATDRRSGLANLATRAEQRGGSFTAGAPADGSGTTLVWVVPPTP